MRTLAALTQARLKEVLRYDAETGLFVWRVTCTGTAGAESTAGHLHARSGYVRISVDAEKYAAHRLAWLYQYGAWPVGEIDHIDGNRANNRIENLRDTNKAGNQQNTRHARSDNKAQMLGVSWNKRQKAWVAQIQANKKKIHLGYFETAPQAHEAYLSAKRSLHTTNTL